MSTTLTLGSVTLHLPLQHGAALIVDANGANVAVCLGDIDTSENTARLFAASPDLLLAAEAVVDSYENASEYGVDRDAIDALRTAIARARGRETI